MGSYPYAWLLDENRLWEIAIDIVPNFHDLDFSTGNRPPLSTQGYGRYCYRFRVVGQDDRFSPWETVNVSPLLVPLPPAVQGVRVRLLFEPAVGVEATVRRVRL